MRGKLFLHFGGRLHPNTSPPQNCLHTTTFNSPPVHLSHPLSLSVSLQESNKRLKDPTQKKNTMPNIPPPRSFFSRQRTPIFIVLGGGLFIGLKWRAVMQRSDEAKRASAKGSYHVDAGERSGRWWDLVDDDDDDDESNDGLDDDNVYCTLALLHSCRGRRWRITYI
ncbi:hypothetical protein HYALB_00007319 [Hymenoscyphus albidus]|uniref:Uncharacterized protein n=1 Tax=Hymenoscyphus albidus TaxID=595503 RepID=A0A9N9LGC4_9HELO|nr:hypothetical protein HYALB_00007319 [Hymenoscyphus albidus]